MLKNVTEWINPETGEVVTTSKTFANKVKPESFYMTFIKHVGVIYGVRSTTDLHLLNKFLEVAEYNTGVVRIPSTLRKRICEELDISTNYFSMSIRRLKEKKLIAGKGGEFTINPHIFWKGDRDSRDKLMKNKEFEITFKLT